MSREVKRSKEERNKYLYKVIEAAMQAIYETVNSLGLREEEAELKWDLSYYTMDYLGSIKEQYYEFWKSSSMNKDDEAEIHMSEEVERSQGELDGYLQKVVEAAMSAIYETVNSFGFGEGEDGLKWGLSFQAMEHIGAISEQRHKLFSEKKGELVQ